MLTLNNSFLLNDFVIVNNIYIGKIIKRLWNGLGFIIKLENRLNYIDNIIVQYKLLDSNITDYTGYKMITPNDDIRSVNANNLHELIINELKNEQFIFIDEKLNNNYNKFKKDILPNYKTIITNLNEYKPLVGGQLQLNYSKIRPIDQIPEIHLPTPPPPQPVEQPPQPVEQQPSPPVEQQLPPPVEQPITDQSSIKQLGTSQYAMYEDDDKNEDAYKLYIDNLISNLFTETKRPFVDGFNDGKITAGEAENIGIIEENSKLAAIKPGIKKYLELFDSINKSKLYDFKTSIMFKHILTDNLDIISLGREIIDKIKNKLLEAQQNLLFNDGTKMINDINLFDYLNFEINNGYIIISDRTKKTERVITKDLIPNLDELKDQYDKPIDYNYLKGLIFQNKTTLEINKNKCLLAESLKILSQEYIIALQPKIEYLIWAIIRLILCWYSSEVLNENIYKIKILINLYRARGIKTFNKDNDILPLIMILPNYGKTSALKVVTHINYFFFPYRNLGWVESPPTYFKKVDDLLYYTNGSLNIKKYIKFLLSNKENLEMPFINDYTKVKLTNNSNNIEFEE
jgi:hypothetical protein